MKIVSGTTKTIVKSGKVSVVVETFLDSEGSLSCNRNHWQRPEQSRPQTEILAEIPYGFWIVAAIYSLKPKCSSRKCQGFVTMRRLWVDVCGERTIIERVESNGLSTERPGA